ncbi:carboxypeptidase regulatory-like domain-containing protein [Micromonospora sp. CPCC 206060]|uniref:carboxypeptidase regulatory-like domain-containing protein n=1 Tax=Micromonospora sp. CPCC 206060 TaxID=3122406 RepID=UPI002FF0281C
MAFTKLGRLALAAAVLGAVVLPGGSPAHAADTGVIAGQLTTSAGTGAANATVHVYREDNGIIDTVGWTTTDEQGNYQIGGLRAAPYAVGFEPQGGPTQFYRQKLELWDADWVNVADGATTTVNDQLLPTGAITGQIRTATGDPASYLLISAYEVNEGNWAYGSTDEEGRYRITATPGTYQVSFQPIPDSYQSQFIPGQIEEEAGQLFQVTAGGEVVANDTVLPVGSLSGRLTSQGGAAVAGADVGVMTAGWGNGGYTTTDTNGNFSFPALFAGSYRVSFSQGDRTQYYQGKLTFEEATPVTVAGGQETRITESWLATGAVRVTAVDAVSGAPVADFCVESFCSNGTGKATVTGLPQGNHTLWVYPEDKLHFGEDLAVEVVGGQTVDVTVRLRVGAAITTRITDRATGNGVANVCLDTFLPKQVRQPDGRGDCSDSTGQITVGPLEPGQYRLFAVPRGDSVYGRQWVGATGGTGDERQAAAVPTWAGRTSTAPVVKLDRAGTVTGLVTDAGTGAPLPEVGVDIESPGTDHGASVVTGADGRYRLTGVGPYQWPLVFMHKGYTQYSGGTADRYAATKVAVPAGGTATYNLALQPGVKISGSFTNQDGARVEYGRIVAHNVTTGDVVGLGYVDYGQINLTALGGQSVYFTYDVSFGNDEYIDGQYPLPPSTRSRPGGPTLATPGIAVPTTGPFTVNIVIRTN